ncbi:hypothetical protein [Paenibacillus spongiae]|uniref:DUF3619 family protein n=1 Tax=Paenibacillus spongiae TaxID=2909671 RepID=A0ABY5S9U2_9BACL|nr:hypothetical protein [Paenibacillus spongiae]UVI29592.1 hypothetical protein L1F29_29950 [Paenibacillus spongiae]
MTDEQGIKSRLDEELAEIKFTGHARVRNRTHPRTWRDKASAFWNKELELPLLPIGAAAALLLFWAASLQPDDSSTEGEIQLAGRELIEAGGNTYWKDVYEEAVRKHEDENKG